MQKGSGIVNEMRRKDQGLRKAERIRNWEWDAQKGSGIENEMRRKDQGLRKAEMIEGGMRKDLTLRNGSTAAQNGINIKD